MESGQHDSNVTEMKLRFIEMDSNLNIANLEV